MRRARRDKLGIGVKRIPKLLVAGLPLTLYL